MNKNYIEYKDTIAFHPGYYIKEIIDESGLTQEDFAKRLDTTPKNISVLIRGEQSLSTDIAMKLSRMIGTSVEYWLNLQNAYDAQIARFKSDEELLAEKVVFKYLNYSYFEDNYGLPHLPRKINEQIKAVREFLNVSTLTVFTKKDMAVSFRSSASGLSEANIVKANSMVQIATNTAIKEVAPKFDRRLLDQAINYSLTLTEEHKDFYPLVKEAFYKAGVIIVVLPNIPGSKINGATKKLGKNIMLMVNDRNMNSDSFWFTLFHEVGHIINGDYGISFEKETGIKENEANRFAEDCLIPPDAYQEFVMSKNYGVDEIRAFAKEIHRDPGIVLGRLQKDGLVNYDNWSMNSLRHKYIIKCEKRND